MHNAGWKENVSRLIEADWISTAEREGHSALHRKNRYSPVFVPVEKVTGWEQFQELAVFEVLRPSDLARSDGEKASRRCVTYALYRLRYPQRRA